MMGLAVGEPLTLGVGAWGLPVLLPGCLGIVWSSYREVRKVGYAHPMTLGDKLAHPTVPVALAGAGTAYLDTQLLLA